MALASADHITPTGLRLPPGPPKAKTLIDKLRMLNRFNTNMMGVLGEFRVTYGDFYVLHLEGLYQYVTARPELMHQVMVAQASKFRKNRDYYDTKQGMARFLGSGLLTNDGEFWKRQRKLVAPAFHAKRVGAYAETMVDYTLKMLDGWRDEARLDISREMTTVTMKIVARTLFNTDVSTDVHHIGESVNAMQDYAGRLRILPAWVPTPAELRARRARRDFDEVSYRFIRERRQNNEDRGDLLSMLLLAQDDSGNGMTDQQARDEAVTLFLAGHETTANTLNWTFYLLAQNPAAEAKLHAELDNVLAGKPPTLADLDRLPYTQMVIKESMRLYPAAWGVSREALEDVELDGYTIPKGSVVGLFTYFVHRDPRYWPDADKFDPERFSAENEPNIPHYAYIPFGGGPRVCIGNAFAMMEARLLLATIASRYSLSLRPGQKVEMLPLITLNPKGGLPMTVHQRRPALPLSAYG